MMERAKAFVTNKDEGQFHILASDDSVDRDGERIDRAAWSKTIEDFKANPVLLWAHDYSTPPVGRIDNVSVTSKGLEGDVTFAKHAFAKDIEALYEDGIMRSFSVGFLPKDAKSIDGVYTYTDVELLEISAVPVPANRAAQVMRAADPNAMPKPEEGETSVGYQWRLIEQGYLEPDAQDPDEYVADLADEQLREECESLMRQIDDCDDRMESMLRNLKVSGGEFVEEKQ